MNLKITALMATGLLGAASLALAQTGNTGNTGYGSSSSSSPSSNSSMSSSSTDSTGKMTSHEFMKECMQMGKSANNGMSKMDMRKSCHSQYRKYKSGEQQEPMAPQPNT
ncbi:MAG TPA: hypothetical protein VKT22_11090 [Steroidobacteraceae bacterium]|nr:hypothetical protein [Steroidobacteraceae bacterium]